MPGQMRFTACLARPRKKVGQEHSKCSQGHACRIIYKPWQTPHRNNLQLQFMSWVML